VTTTINNNNISAVINHKGAELISLQNKSKREFIWEGDPAFWAKHSPVLFPIVGTLKSNTFYHNGKNYSLPRHGFARDMDFKLLEDSGESAIFSIESNNDTFEKYPFEFEFRIIYTLDKNSLKIRYEVLNKSAETMFFSVGAHPAFALPGFFEDYSIEMESDEDREYFLLENDLLSDKTETVFLENKAFHLNYPLFEKDALIFKNIQSQSLKILEKEKPMLEINFTDFPHLGIWTKPEARFICIEPWFGYSDTTRSNDALSEKEAIQALENNRQFRAEFSINLL
jgi:galactose mutarotase-like enzyme